MLKDLHELHAKYYKRLLYYKGMPCILDERGSNQMLSGFFSVRRICNEMPTDASIWPIKKWLFFHYFCRFLGRSQRWPLIYIYIYNPVNHRMNYRSLKLIPDFWTINSPNGIFVEPLGSFGPSPSFGTFLKKGEGLFAAKIFPLRRCCELSHAEWKVLQFGNCCADVDIPWGWMKWWIEFLMEI